MRPNAQFQIRRDDGETPNNLGHAFANGIWNRPNDGIQELAAIAFKTPRIVPGRSTITFAHQHAEGESQPKAQPEDRKRRRKRVLIDRFSRCLVSLLKIRSVPTICSVRAHFP
jgi:hypothetical protein